MRVSNAILLVVCIVAISVVFSVWLIPSTQDFVTSNTLWNGIKNFRGDFNVEVLASLETLPDRPEKSLIVIIPYSEYTSEDITRIKDFIWSGGAVLLMDDFGYGNSILQGLGTNARFDGTRLADPLFNYRNDRIPKILDFSAEAKNSGIEQVVLNHATVLKNISETDVIAKSSSASFLDINENDSLEKAEQEGPFPVVALITEGKGRLILFSDPSIIVDGMLNRGDNSKLVNFLISYRGEERAVSFDESHLVKTTLDISKTRTLELREILVQPYVLLGIIILVFIAVHKLSFVTGVFNGK